MTPLIAPEHVPRKGVTNALHRRFSGWASETKLVARSDRLCVHAQLGVPPIGLSSSASSPNMCARTSASKTPPGAETKKLLTGSGNARLIGGDLLIAFNPISDLGEVALCDGIGEAIPDLHSLSFTPSIRLRRASQKHTRPVVLRLRCPTTIRKELCGGEASERGEATRPRERLGPPFTNSVPENNSQTLPAYQTVSAAVPQRPARSQSTWTARS